MWRLLHPKYIFFIDIMVVKFFLDDKISHIGYCYYCNIYKMYGSRFFFWSNACKIQLTKCISLLSISPLSHTVNRKSLWINKTNTFIEMCVCVFFFLRKWATNVFIICRSSYFLLVWRFRLTKTIIFCFFRQVSDKIMLIT